MADDDDLAQIAALGAAAAAAGAQPAGTAEREEAEAPANAIADDLRGRTS